MGKELTGGGTRKSTVERGYQVKEGIRGIVIIPLHFKPEESAFVVFREGKISEDQAVRIEKDAKEIFPILVQ